jgi:hypothetical protein
MTSQELDRQIEQFKLEKDGDNTEVHLWSLLKNDFPMYEQFWRRYVVPLTFRLRPGLPPEKAIRLRPAAKRFERMAMTHYSVFHYLGYATERIRFAKDDDRLLAGDAFYRLDSSIDNLQYFLDELHHIGGDFDIKFPKEQVKNAKKPRQVSRDTVPIELRMITDYRDTLLHNPVLGRAIDRGVEKLPKWEHLSKAKESWFCSERLSDDELIATRSLLESLRLRYCEYLDKKWLEVLSRLEGKREKFAQLLNLDEDLDVQYVNVSMPLTVSGAQFKDPPIIVARSDLHSLGIFQSQRGLKQ